MRKAPDSDVQSLFPKSERSELEKVIVQIFHTHLAELIPDQEEQKISLGKKIFLVRQHSFKRPATTWSGLTRYVKLIFDEKKRSTDWLLVQSTDRPGLFAHRTLQLPLDDLAQAIVDHLPEEKWPAVVPIIPQPHPDSKITLSQHWQALVSLYLRVIHVDKLFSLNRFALASLIANYSEGFFNGEPGFEPYLIELLATFYQKKEAPEAETLADRFNNRVSHQILKRVSSFSVETPFEAPIYLWNSLQFLARHHVSPEIIESIATRCQKPVTGSLPSLLNFLQKAQQFKELSHADLTLCLQFLVMPLIEQRQASNSPIACKIVPLAGQSILAVDFKAIKRTVMLPVPNRETFSQFCRLIPRLAKQPEVVQSFLEVLLELWKNNQQSSTCLYQEQDLWLAIESNDSIEALCGSLLYLTGGGKPDHKETLLLLSAMRHLFLPNLPHNIALYWLNQMQERLKESSLPEFAGKANHLFIQLEHNLNEKPLNLHKSLFDWLNTLVLFDQECLNTLAYSIWNQLADLSETTKTDLRNDTTEKSLHLADNLRKSMGGITYAVQVWEQLTSKISSHQAELINAWIELAQSCPSSNFYVLQKLAQGASLWKQLHHTYIPSDQEKQLLVPVIEKIGTALPHMSRPQFYLDCVKAGWIDLESQENQDLLFTLSHELISAVGLEHAAKFWKQIDIQGQPKAFEEGSLISPILQSLAFKLEEKKFYTACDEIITSFAPYPKIIEESLPLKNLILRRLEAIISEKGIEAAQRDSFYITLFPIVKNHTTADRLYEKAFQQSITNKDWKGSYSLFFNIPPSHRTMDSLIKLTRLISQAAHTESAVEHLRTLSKCEIVNSKKLSNEQIEFKCLFLKRLWMEEGEKARTEWIQVANDLMPHLSFIEPLEQTEGFYCHFIEVIAKLGDPRIPFPTDLKQNVEKSVEKIFSHLKTPCSIRSFRTLHLHFSSKKITAAQLIPTNINWSTTLADPNPELRESVSYLFSCVKQLPKTELSSWSNSISLWISSLYERSSDQASSYLNWWLEAVSQSNENQLTIEPNIIALRSRLDSNQSVKLYQTCKNQLPPEEDSFLWLSEAIETLLSAEKDEEAYHLLMWVKNKSVKDELYLPTVDLCQRHASRLLNRKNLSLALPHVLKLVDYFPRFSPEWEAAFTLLSTSTESVLLQQAWNKLLIQTVSSPYHPSAIKCWELLLENGLSSSDAHLYWPLIDISTLSLLREKFTKWKQLSKWQVLCLLIFQEGIKFPESIKNIEAHHLFLCHLHTLLKEEQMIQDSDWEINHWVQSLLAQKSTSALKIALEFVLKEMDLSKQLSLHQKIYEAVANFSNEIQCPIISKNLIKIVNDAPRPTFKEKWLILSALKNVKGIDSISTSLLIAQELITFSKEDCSSEIQWASISDHLTNLIRLANTQHQKDCWIAINIILQSPDIRRWIPDDLSEKLIYEYRLEQLVDAQSPKVSSQDSMARLTAYSFNSSLLKLSDDSLKMALHIVAQVMQKVIRDAQAAPSTLNDLENLSSAIFQRLAPHTVAVYFNHPDSKMSMFDFVTAALTSDLEKTPPNPEKNCKSSFFRIQWLNALLDIKEDLSSQAAQKVFEWIETHVTGLIKDVEKHPILKRDLEIIFAKAFLNKNLFKHNFARANEIFSKWFDQLISHFPINHPTMLQALLYVKELTTCHKEVDSATHANYIHSILTRLALLGQHSFLKSTTIFRGAQNSKFGTSKDILRWFKVVMNHWKSLPSSEIDQWSYIYSLFGTFLPGELKLMHRPEHNLEATFIPLKPEVTSNLILYPILDQMCSMFSIALMDKFIEFRPWKSEDFVDKNIFFQFIFRAIHFPLQSGTYCKRLPSYLTQVEKYGDFILSHFKSPDDWKELYKSAINFVNLIQKITHFDSNLDQKELYGITKTFVDWFYKLKKHPHLTEENFNAHVKLVYEYVKPFLDLDPNQNRRMDILLPKAPEVKPERKRKQKVKKSSLVHSSGKSSAKQKNSLK